MSASPQQFYRELLNDSALATASHAMLAEELHRRNLYYGNRRPLCTILRPRFLSKHHYQQMAARAGAISSAIRTLHCAAIENAEVRQQFRLNDWEEQLLPIRSGYSCRCPISRFDGFLAADGRIRFSELNAQSPAGAGFSDGLSNSFARLPAMVEFAKTYPCQAIPMAGTVLGTLLRMYREWAGNSNEKPRIAIVDWEDVPTQNDFVLLQEAFADAGYPTRIVSPNDLEFAGEKLLAHGEPITLVYRRVMMNQLVDRCGIEHPLIRAAKAGAVCVVNPISCRLPGKKATFALLSDDENASRFTLAQQEAIRESIPWTRFVEERRTRIDGREIELIPFLLKSQDRFVLKPNDAYGGSNVVLGWTVDASRWEAAVTAAIREPSVVQERIVIPNEEFPTMEGGELRDIRQSLDTCPFVNGEATTFGCITRLSSAGLINVATGSSMVPTFLV